MKSKFYLIIDFDSTLIKVETLECLAEIALDNSKNKNQIIKEINQMTDLAMSGKMSFNESINNRLSLLNLKKEYISKIINQITENFDTTFLKNLEFLESYIDQIYIVSGGFREIIELSLKAISNKKWNIFANNFIFNDQKIIGIDNNNPLAKNHGKVELIKSLNLKGEKIIIGDGYTDYEVKKYNQAKYFLCYNRHINRQIVANHADLICDDFEQVVNFIKEKYF
tara:strand:+ start:525 stop:1199 length:675 start_codon:yes stop_codon:yes gene_type:complete